MKLLLCLAILLAGCAEVAVAEPSSDDPVRPAGNRGVATESATWDRHAVPDGERV
jgi:hypothetical protein